MFRLASSAIAITLSLAALGAETQPAAGEPAQVIALNTHREGAAAEPKSLDDYAGVYASADGATFVVVRAGNSLAVELPESMSLPVRTANGTTFVLDGAAVRIAFETDADGQLRMVVSQPAGEPVVATRVTLPRGIVTIHDI